MRSLKDISLNISEEEYRKMPELSYSTLAKYERGGFNSLSTLFDKVESPSLLFGWLHCITDNRWNTTINCAICTTIPAGAVDKLDKMGNNQEKHREE